ncbi:hypothetical protein [Streptomyces alkaliphilus]|uniref:hypothetical protein n=1 Tax=Streptomyces alkaliphilus TaxID=1472722 RepID=UPI00117CCC2C|nr:hypothetical protein [Streptomyces alkaliphilus]MQS05762.1 hypothetical protein [Streptomyces alkaliphilus]
MSTSFHAVLIRSTGPLHLYRVLHDGGDRTAHLVLDTAGGEVFPADADGVRRGTLVLSLADGNHSGEPAEGDEPLGDFLPSAAHIARAWINDGTPPEKVIRYFG